MKQEKKTKSNKTKRNNKIEPNRIGKKLYNRDYYLSHEQNGPSFENTWKVIKTKYFSQIYDPSDSQLIPLQEWI